MIVTYGSTAISLPPAVVLFDLDEAVPVFHAGADDWRLERDDEGETIAWSIATRCGRVTYGERGDEVETPATGFAIPARHAIRFGRPCRRCWPILLKHPSLFDRPRRSSDPGEQLEL